MFAREELSRLRVRKGELLQQADRDRSALGAALRDVRGRLGGVQRIGQVFRAAVQWQALLMPMALLVLPRRARGVIRLVSEAARAFRLAKVVTALWHGVTANVPSQGPPGGLA